MSSFCICVHSSEAQNQHCGDQNKESRISDNQSGCETLSRLCGCNPLSEPPRLEELGCFEGTLHLELAKHFTCWSWGGVMLFWKDLHGSVTPHPFRVIISLHTDKCYFGGEVWFGRRHGIDSSDALCKCLVEGSM